MTAVQFDVETNQIPSNRAKTRVVFALPGLHRVVRGAEVAFEELGRHLCSNTCDVTLIGSGSARNDLPYRFIHAGCLRRELFEKWPRFPGLRSHYMYEELSFAPALLHAYIPTDYDVSVTCAYPYTNWLLRARKNHGKRPLHVYVTQNGDWMIQAKNWEYRHFGCEGLVCTNPEFFERHHKCYPTALIPNGVDPNMFFPGEAKRTELGLPESAPIVLMVSAFINSKRVLEAIRAMSRMKDVVLVVAGAGELESQAQSLAGQVMPGRYFNLKLPRAKMPSLYRSADVFLHMSMIESSANAYVEALATGLPIVTHDRSVTRWTLEDTSILVNTESDDEVIDGVTRALRSNFLEQQEIRRNLALRRFSWSTIARQYEEFFLQLLATREAKVSLAHG